MTALAAAALLLAIAAWARPRPGARAARTVEWRGWRRRPTTPPTVDEWAALLDSMSAEVRTGSSLAAAVAHALSRCQPQQE